MRLTALATIAFVTCAFAPNGATPWVPPAHYREVWDSAQACTGKHGNYDRIHWFTVPGNEFSTEDGAAIGQWDQPHDIYIAYDWRTTDWVAKHEMVHDLTGYLHDGSNDRPGPRDTLVWGKRCHAMWGFQPIDSTYRP